MQDIPNYRLGIQLSGPGKIPYRYSEQIQKKLYNDVFRGSAIGEKVHADKYSLFTFSLLAGNPRFDKDGFASIDCKWIFRFASAYRDLLGLLESELTNREEIDLLGQGTPFQINNIYREPLMSRNIFQAQPIFTADRDKKVLRPQDEEYFNSIKTTLEKKWSFFFGEECPGELKGLKFTKNPRQKKIQYKNRRLTCFAGPVKLQGEEGMLKFAQCVGLGHLTSCGLGMLV